MSTVAEIVAAVERLPETQKNEVLIRLLELKSALTNKQANPYVVQSLPLGIRTDKLPSHLLEELDDEEFIQKFRGAK
jgi:hypothetical protein